MGVEFSNYIEIASERRGKDFSYDMSSKKLRNLAGSQTLIFILELRKTKYWIENNFKQS